MLAVRKDHLVDVRNRKIHQQAERKIEIHADAQRFVVAADFFISRLGNQCGLQSHDAFIENIAELDAAVQRGTEAPVSSGPAALASAKQLIGAVANLSLEDASPVTSKWIAALRATPEAREGFAAFLKKRKPAWMQ